MRRAKLPALPPVQTNDAQLKRWMEAVAERLEVREGTRGDPDERVITVREWKGMQRLMDSVVERLEALTRVK